MANDRHTPYKAQLDRFLGAHPTDPFSARTLSDRFENGHRDERSMLRGIQAELQQAFADGRLVQYRDAEGQTLTESTAGKVGSQRLRRPVFYGLAEAPVPDAGAMAVTYKQSMHKNGSGNAGEPTDEEERTDDSDDDGPADDAEEPAEMPKDEVIRWLKAYPPPGSRAPAWVDERLLRVWVSLPGVSKSFVHRLEVTKGPERFELIRAGVHRKLRNGWRSESTVAGNLALLCRRSQTVWLNTVRPALEHYASCEDGVPFDELSQLSADPLDYYDDSEHAPDAVLLYAMALGVDESALEMIAADCATLLGEIKVTEKATAQQERIDTLEAEAIELRRTAKDADKELRATRKRERLLNEENERLRSAQAEAGSTAQTKRAHAEQELRRRAEDAEAALEELRGEAERVPELEAQVEGLEGARERLEDAEVRARDEHRLRVQAEQDAERHSVRVRELTDQLTSAVDSRNLPLDNAVVLVDALTRPIGQAARHAAERLAAGRARPHDDLLLELASTVAQMSHRLDADIYEPPEIETDEAAEAPDAVVLEEVSAPPTPGPATEPAAAPTEPEAEQQPENATEPAAPEPGAPGLAGRRRRRSRIKVRPLGGAGEVGGSAILVTNASGHTVLLDCGQRVRGEYGLDTEPQFHRRIGQDGRLHAILLSHAHIDHVGSLPLLHREQSDSQHEPIPVYMTAPTRQLASIMLGDSAKIQQHREGSRAEQGFLDYGAGTMEAAYRISDVKRVLDDEFVIEVSPALAVPIPDTSFVARFLPVAHVLGSCAIHLTDTENDQTLLYTGDLGPFADPQATLPQYTLSEMLTADLVIMESTYGTPPKDTGDGRRLRRALSGRERAIKQLCQAAEQGHERGGCVLLPAFSLGRTQELAMIIQQARHDGDAPNGEIVVAGMGEKITQVYDQYSKGANPWARAENLPRLDELGKRMKRDDLDFEDVVGEVLAAGFSYIIASPAMLASGWSRTFLNEMVEDPAHAIVMSGYIPRHAGNIPRLHMLRRGEVIDLGYRKPKIQADFLRLQGLSAHAPSVDLRKFADYMARQGNHVAFGMVHGEPASQDALAHDVDALPDASAEALYNGQVWQPSRP